MPVTSAVAVPHPPIILPDVGRGRQKEIQKTIDSYNQAMAFLAGFSPKTVVIISSHATQYRDFIAIYPGREAKGSFANFGAPQLVIRAAYDEDLARAIQEEAEAAGLPAGMQPGWQTALDHGTTIPLYFLNQVYQNYEVVRIGISELPPQTHYQLGQCIQRAAAHTPVAVIASGDLAHRLREEGPYGFDPAAPRLDSQINSALASGDFGALMRVDPQLACNGAECGLQTFVMMAGTLDGYRVEAELLSYEDTFGVGYSVATFLPTEKDDSRHFS